MKRGYESSRRSVTEIAPPPRTLPPGSRVTDMPTRDPAPPLRGSMTWRAAVIAVVVVGAFATYCAVVAEALRAAAGAR